MKNLLVALLMLGVPAGAQNIVNVIRDKSFYPENYGGKPDDSTDDKTAIQDAINAAYTAGGGVVKLKAGVWDVKPLATGIGILCKTGVVLEGSGPNTVVRFWSSTSSASFAGVAPYGYNTTTTSFGGHEVRIRNLKLECDGYILSSDSDHANAAGLLDLVHCPGALIENVTFGNVCYHQTEIQASKNIVFTRCLFRGNTEAPRVQFDAAGGSAALRANLGFTPFTEHVIFDKCDFAAHNVDGVTISSPVYAQVELDHTGNQLLRNVTFRDCEFGPTYDSDSTSFSYYGIAINSGSNSLSRLENLTITGCRFLGNGLGSYFAVSLVPVASSGSILSGLTVENNWWGSGYDIDGLRCPGGFYQCLAIGSGLSGASVDGGTTTTTDYQYRSGIRVVGNRFFPRFVQGLSAVTAGVCDVVQIGACMDAVIENNQIYYPAYGAAVSSANTSTEVLTMGSNHGFEVGDAVRFSSVSSLAFGGSVVGTSTTYYVISTPSLTTLKVSATLGGGSVDVTTSGTATLNTYHTLTIGTNCAFVVNQIPNCRFSNNLVQYEHNASASSSVFYSIIMDWSGIEALGSTVGGMVEIVGNRVMETGAGSGQQGYKIYNGASTTTKYVKGRYEGNILAGTWSSGTTLTGFPWWATSGTYTPTASAASNLDSAATPTVAQWTRNGDVVTVSGSFTADATAAGAASFELTLPLASDLTQVYDAGGTAATGAIAERPAVISGTVTNNTVKFDWIAQDTTSRVWYYTYTYQLK